VAYLERRHATRSATGGRFICLRTSSTPIPPPRQQWQRCIDKLQRLVLERPYEVAAIVDRLEQVVDRLDDTPA
jgi:hypothetical protein